jgi:hypothetical protein
MVFYIMTFSHTETIELVEVTGETYILEDGTHQDLGLQDHIIYVGY